MKKKLTAKTQCGFYPLHSFLKYLSLKLRIKKNEGFSKYPYKDNLGNYTIGHGHLIRNNEKVFFKKSFNKSFFHNLFEYDFSSALEDYQKNFKRFSFAQNIQELIIRDPYQLGGHAVNFDTVNNIIKDSHEYDPLVNTILWE